jgi:hypothetical protein
MIRSIGTLQRPDLPTAEPGSLLIIIKDNAPIEVTLDIRLWGIQDQNFPRKTKQVGLRFAWSPARMRRNKQT